LTLLLLSLSLSLTLSAQTGHTFSGTVESSEGTLTGAQVTLWRGDSIQAAGLTDKQGKFVLMGIPTDTYILQVAMQGYTTYEDTQRLIDKNSTAQFRLDRELTAKLDEVEVTGNRANMVQRTAVGQLFFLSEEAKNSGDPYKALQEIPRLNVIPATQSITMDNGERVLILIDGSSYHTGVNPIDPKIIESVEVRDVVSARYLRSGVRHILNIKLKKQRAPYRYFEAATRHDVPWRWGFGGIYFEVGNEKVSLYGRTYLEYMHNDDIETSGWQKNTNYEKTHDYKTQDNGTNQYAELIFKWRMAPKDFLLAHVWETYTNSRSTGTGNGTYRTTAERAYDYLAHDKVHSSVWTGTLYHRHDFSASKQLETALAVNSNRNNTEGDRKESYVSGTPYSDRYDYRNRRLSGSLNIDYSWDINKVSSFNAGSETKFVNDRIHQVSENLPLFRHREWNQYLYASFSSQWKKLYYMLSLGMEGIWLKAGDVNGRYFKPRAEVSGNYSINDHNSLFLSYTLTNTQPAVGQLNPYNTSTDSLVIQRGNPGLLPMQAHVVRASYTFNTGGLYLTPYIAYGYYDDIIEPSGENVNGIYISSYQNTGRKQSVTVGGSASYRFARTGRIYAGAYHTVQYYPGLDPMKSFNIYAGISYTYKKWYFGLNADYKNYEYSPISRTRNHAPSYSLAQITYNFTKQFYISCAMQYITGPLHSDTFTYGGSYTSFTSQKKMDMNLRPWILLRYTFRKNSNKKIKLNNVVTSEEKGINLK
jgi:hypothetical protein